MAISILRSDVVVSMDRIVVVMVLANHCVLLSPLSLSMAVLFPRSVHNTNGFWSVMQVRESLCFSVALC